MTRPADTNLRPGVPLPPRILGPLGTGVSEFENLKELFPSQVGGDGDWCGGSDGDGGGGTPDEGLK